MPDLPITGLTELVSPSPGDVIPIVDIFSGVTKKVRFDAFIGSSTSGNTVTVEESFTGDGVTTEFTIEHDFFNKNISVSVKDDSYIEVYPKKDTSSIYQVVITFTSAPEDGAVYSVLLIGLVNEEPDVEENALLNDDGVTPLLNDDGVTNLLT